MVSRPSIYEKVDPVRPLSRLAPPALVACLAVALLAAGPASGKKPVSTVPTRAKLQRSLDAIVASPGAPPGISVLIQRDGKREFLRAGVGDVKSKRPPGVRDHYRIASIAKAFNALLAVNGGAGSQPLTETVGSRIPGVLPLANEVTLLHLLQHTSGIADYIRTRAFTKALTSDLSRYFAPTELTDFVKDTPLSFPPGTNYHYSDTDNIAAGLMEEAVSGRSYEDLLASEIFGPLRMRASSLPNTVRMARPLMHGYDVEPGKKPEDVSELLNPSGAWASGGIVSTPDDMARFLPVYVPTVLQAFRQVGGAFRPGDSSPPGPGRNFAGPGIFRYRSTCGTVFGHTGSFPGYRLFAAASADGSRSIVFVANAQVVPGSGSAKVSEAIRRLQVRLVCRALG
jgi:D-alanyl-D-alanine carboxypeptidase